MDNFDNEECGYNLNYQNIAKFKNLTNVTRVLAMDLMENPYLMVGDFFQNLSDASLRELVELINKEGEDAEAEILLLSEMLSRAEGIENSIEQMGLNVGIMRALIAGTSLARKGLAKAHYKNFTFGNDNNEAIIFEPVKKTNNDY